MNLFCFRHFSPKRTIQALVQALLSVFITCVFKTCVFKTRVSKTRFSKATVLSPLILSIFLLAIPHTDAYSQTINFSSAISLVQEKARYFVREIDLSIKDIKSKNDSCDRRVIRLREKALEFADTVEFTAAEIPISHTITANPRVIPPGCESVPAAQAVNRTRRAFSSLVSTINNLVRTEKSCRTKYGLSYKPEVMFITEVNRELMKIPRKVISCQ